MHIKEKILDDLLRKVFHKLLTKGLIIRPSKGPAKEFYGALLEISNPRARLSRTETKGTLFSCIGELLWYLSGTNDLDFIQYYLPQYSEYSDDGVTVYGGYGPRIFGSNYDNQFFRVLNILKQRPSSRQAVIQIFDSDDLLAPHEDIPCTCTMQFFVRNNQVHLLVSMRSNDAFLGLPHDVFSFTMIQEIMAASLGYEIGTYKHSVGSLHLYDTNFDKAKQYLAEDWQSTVSMPSMPKGDPWPSIQTVLEFEKKIRLNQPFNENIIDSLHSYWADIIYILIIFGITKRDESLMTARSYLRKIKSDIYSQYILKRIDRADVALSTQMSFFTTQSN